MFFVKIKLKIFLKNEKIRRKQNKNKQEKKKKEIKEISLVI